MLCRYCGADTHEPCLALGRHAFANSFLTEDDLRRVESGEAHEPTLPLDLHLCGDCGLLQIADSPPPEQLFSHYIYVSGTSEAVHVHARRLRELWREVTGGPHGSTVVEIASNDGTVLRVFREAGCRVLGVEPAANVAALAMEAGIPTRVEFFGADSAALVLDTHGPADTILARHVFAHVPDPHGFLEGVRRLLAPGGVLLLEAPYLEPFLARTEVDTVYHEHLAYLSLRPLSRLTAGHGLQVFDLRPFEIHGGSMVYLVGHSGARQVRPTVAETLAREDRLGLAERRTWEAFAARAHEAIGQLRDLLDRLRASGARIAGYGAPAKGNTLLGCLGRGPETVRYLVDQNPWKQGRYTPGTHIPVRPPETLLADRPDYTLLLAWNFEEEILRQQAEYRRRGGRFIRPLPSPEVLA